MKRIELKDMKPGYYWFQFRNDPLEVVRVHGGDGDLLYRFRIGSECEETVDKNDKFYELITPVVGEINLMRKWYDGESIVDMDRDVSEATNGDYNLAAQAIPEMEDSPGFWAGQFVVDITWMPDDEEA
jgi:hypothetical protein